MSQGESSVCGSCGHRRFLHGDRVFGICSSGMAPRRCDCTGYTVVDSQELFTFDVLDLSVEGDSVQAL